MELYKPGKKPLFGFLPDHTHNVVMPPHESLRMKKSPPADIGGLKRQHIIGRTLNF